LDVLVHRYGVTLRTGVRVADIGTSGGQVIGFAANGEQIVADHILICAGLGSASLLRRFGLGSALMPMKGYSITAPPGAHPPKTSITDVARKLVFCPLQGAIRIAGLAELGEHNPALAADRLAVMVDSAQAAFPEMAQYAAPSSIWAGIRPMTANSLPIIQTVAPGITVNIGHGMLGWTYAMGSAERAAHCLLAASR
jgi:D-amino-acid dehydrogenase